MMLLISLGSGCCCPPIAAARNAAKRTMSQNNIHQMLIAIKRYQARNEEAWPDDLAQIKD
jgi:hypothetical protein